MPGCYFLGVGHEIKQKMLTGIQHINKLNLNEDYLLEEIRHALEESVVCNFARMCLWVLIFQVDLIPVLSALAFQHLNTPVSSFMVNLRGYFL